MYFYFAPYLRLTSFSFKFAKMASPTIAQLEQRAAQADSMIAILTKQVSESPYR